jgi:hypothetical protein
LGRRQPAQRRASRPIAAEATTPQSFDPGQVEVNPASECGAGLVAGAPAMRFDHACNMTGGLRGRAPWRNLLGKSR